MSSSPSPVEVRISGQFSWYRATIKDYQNAKFLVEYESNWRGTEWVDPSSVRVAHFEFNPALFHPKPGMAVEALTRAFDNEPYGWWDATVQKDKQVFFLIHYAGYEDSYDEVVELETLRPPNPNPVFSAESLVTATVPFVPQLLAFVQTPESFVGIVNATKVVCIVPDVQAGLLRVVGSADAVKKAKSLLELLLRHETEISKLRAKTSAVAQKVQEERAKYNQSFQIEFPVPKHLMGLIVGKEGVNIKACAKLDGVESVKVIQETGQIRIMAKTEAAAQAARTKLEVVEELIEIPASIIGWVVGKAGKNINEIAKKSEVLRINCVQDQHNKDIAHISIIGSADNVDSAKLMLKHHIQYIEEFKKAEIEAKEAARNLQKLREDFGVGQQRRFEDCMLLF